MMLIAGSPEGREHVDALLDPEPDDPIDRADAVVALGGEVG